jgi:hypothetical protein
MRKTKRGKRENNKILEEIREGFRKRRNMLFQQVE